MLQWAIVFLVFAAIAGVLTFGGFLGASAGAAPLIFFIFLALIAVSLLAGLFRKA